MEYSMAVKWRKWIDFYFDFYFERISFRSHNFDLEKRPYCSHGVDIYEDDFEGVFRRRRRRRKRFQENTKHTNNKSRIPLHNQPCLILLALANETPTFVRYSLWESSSHPYLLAVTIHCNYHRIKFLLIICSKRSVCEGGPINRHSPIDNGWVTFTR